jgi:formate hydrogenlyase transcriptional activator
MLEQHTLLVVDDMPDAVRSLQKLLCLDYTVLSSTSPREALALLRERDVHIVLADQCMPELSGIEFLCRARETCPQAVRLLLTGYPDLKGVMDAVNQGHVFRYMLKPCDPDELTTAVRQAAAQYDLEAERRRLARELTRERDRLRLLLEVTNAVVAHLDLRALFRAIASPLRPALRPDYTSLALCDEAQQTLHLHMLDFPTSTGRIQEGQWVPLAEAPAHLAFRARRPLCFDAHNLQQFPVAAALLEEGVQSLCIAPLLTPGRVLGSLSAASRRPDAFTPDEVELLGQIARQIAPAVANALAYSEIADLKNRLAEEKCYLEEELRTDHNFEDIIGDSGVLQRVLQKVTVVAPTTSTVLIQGETGTGKELIARAIHKLSQRRDKTFVKVNCAAIPMGLLESELFGHEKGAFTGAIARKIGRFELADQGSLFLDEVGDIPIELQPKLLRVLQEQEFERLGSTRTVHVNVRLVAATNRDLAQMVADRQFRSDLYYRLNVFPLTLPPVRDRREDIPLLIRYFARQSARRMGKRIETIPAKALAALCQYPWPGNIREMENFIERAVILSHGTTLQVSLAELQLPREPVESAELTTLEEAEREHILRALRAAGWKVGGPEGAAARLHMKRTTLHSRMRKLGISRPHS